MENENKIVHSHCNKDFSKSQVYCIFLYMGSFPAILYLILFQLETISDSIKCLCFDYNGFPSLLHPLVLRFKVKEISYINGDAKIVPETKTVYKLSAQTDLQKEALWLRDGLECTCDEMSDINGTYLVMGQYQDGNLVITSLKRWQKVQRETKQLFRKNRKLQC